VVICPVSATLYQPTRSSQPPASPQRIVPSIDYPTPPLHNGHAQSRILRRQNRQKPRDIHDMVAHSYFSLPFLLTLFIRGDCLEQVDGYPCARYKKLRTLEEAEAWMQRTAPYPVKYEIKPANHPLDKARTPIGSQPSQRVSASSSSSIVGQAKSESQTTPDQPSARSPAAAGPSRTSATAEDVVYTDGACSGNGQLGSVAGIGVWWGVDDPRYVLFPTNTAVHLCLPDGW
jgi:hypothetical protein